MRDRAMMFVLHTFTVDLVAAVTLHRIMIDPFLAEIIHLYLAIFAFLFRIQSLVMRFINIAVLIVFHALMKRLLAGIAQFRSRLVLCRLFRVTETIFFTASAVCQRAGDKLMLCCFFCRHLRAYQVSALAEAVPRFSEWSISTSTLQYGHVTVTGVCEVDSSVEG